MLCGIKDGVWFDDQTLQIYRGGNPSIGSGTEPVVRGKGRSAPSVHDENWKPTLIFLASTACNLKCRYCYAHEGTYGIHSGKRFFGPEDFIEVYEKLRDLYGGIRAVSFFGGEPLLNYRAIRKFMDYLYKKEDPDRLPTFGINTNGTILNPEILDLVRTYHPILGTSIDGTREVHDRNRIGDGIRSTYELTRRNLDVFAGCGAKIFVQYTFTRQHLESYKPGAGIRWCREMEELPILSYELVPVSTSDPEYQIDMRDPVMRGKYENFCTEIADYYLEKLKSGDVERVPRMFIGLFTRLLLRMEQRECSAGYSMSVTPDRIVYPCHTFTEYREYGIPLADIHTRDDLDRNPHFIRVREANRDRNETCRRCFAYKICGFWCKGLQHSVNGSLTEELEERCVMMRIMAGRCISFIAEEYGRYRTEVNRSIVRYNKTHAA